MHCAIRDLLAMGSKPRNSLPDIPNFAKELIAAKCASAMQSGPAAQCCPTLLRFQTDNDRRCAWPFGSTPTTLTSFEQDCPLGLPNTMTMARAPSSPQPVGANRLIRPLRPNCAPQTVHYKLNASSLANCGYQTAVQQHNWRLRARQVYSEPQILPPGAVCPKLRSASRGLF